MLSVKYLIITFQNILLVYLLFCIKMKPLVSFYRQLQRYGLLTSCLDSIFLNNYSNYEIIADNGSTDNSVSKLEISILNLDTNLRY